MHPYTQQIDGGERHFEIYEVSLDGDDAAQKLLGNMQTMALWFIEGPFSIAVALGTKLILILCFWMLQHEKQEPTGSMSRIRAGSCI